MYAPRILLIAAALLAVVAARQKRSPIRVPVDGFGAPLPVYRQQVAGPVYQQQRALPLAQGRPAKKKDEQDLSKIPGRAGVDFPLFRSVPPTSFSCAHVPFAPGMYANVETGCQAYHVCHDGREGEQGASFLCPNGTLFNQAEFACDWWYNVNCQEAPKLYDLNTYAEKNPFYPKKKVEEVPEHPEEQQYTLGHF